MKDKVCITDSKCLNDFSIFGILEGAEIPNGANEASLLIEVQAGTRAGEYTLGVLGQGQVPFTKKSDGSEFKNTLISLPSQPITLSVQSPESSKK